MLNITNWGNCNEVGKIVFYNNGEKIEVSTSSYMTEVYEVVEENTLKRVYNETLKNICCSKEFKRAIKENLNRKDNYYMTYKPDYSYDKKTALYIYCNFKVKEVISDKWKDQTNYINFVTVNIPGIFEVVEREELPYDPEFRLPDGAKWHKTYNGYSYNNTYSVVELNPDNPLHKRRLDAGQPEKYIVHFTTKEVAKNEVSFKVGPYTRIEYSEKKIREMELSKELSEITGINIGYYAIEKILAKYDLVKKEA